MSGPKEKSNQPGSNYEKEIPKGREPLDHKTVKKAEDQDYNKEEANFKNPAKKRELSEQPVHPIKK